MGQDSIYLQVISSDKDEPQHKNAKRVYKLLESGKHWVLVTLLLANVVVNESLPVVLDRCLGGGVAAIVGSTALIGKMESQTAAAIALETLQSFKSKTDALMMMPQQLSLEKSFRSPSAYDMAFRSVDTCPSLFWRSCT